MITFKNYLAEGKYPDPTPARDITSAEMVKLLSKGQINSLKRNKAVEALSGMDQDYVYSVTVAGFVKLQIYAGYSQNGKLDPTRLVIVTMDPRKVVGVERYFKAEGTNTWKHLG